MGKLIFRYGSMTSGKSLNLLNVDFNYRENGVNVLILKPSVDTRGIGQINTRLSYSLTAKAYPFSKGENLIEKFTSLEKELLKGEKFEVLLVDESQFITKEQADQLARIAYSNNIMVICYGLKIDFRGRPFEGSAQLMAMASNIEEIKTICEECAKHKAIFPLLYIDGKLIKESDDNLVIDTGGDIKYKQVCGRCYYDIIDESK